MVVVKSQLFKMIHKQHVFTIYLISKSEYKTKEQLIFGTEEKEEDKNVNLVINYYKDDAKKESIFKENFPLKIIEGELNFISVSWIKNHKTKDYRSQKFYVQHNRDKTNYILGN